MKKKRFVSALAICALCATMTVPVMGAVPEEAESVVATDDGLLSLEAVDQIQEQIGTEIALDNVGISVVVNDYKVIRQEEDDCVYIYTDEDESIPYIIICNYDFSDDTFIEMFSEYLSDIYDDLTINNIAEDLALGEHTFSMASYSYTVSGVKVEDIRLFSVVDGKTYMFGSKEIPELDHVNSAGLLEDIASSFSLLDSSKEYAKHVTKDESLVAGDDIMNTVQNDGTTLEFHDDKASYEGVWAEFEDGFKLYLPISWMVYEVPEDQVAAGCVYQAGDPALETDDTAPYIAVSIGESYGLESMEQVGEALKLDNYDVQGIVTVNGIECVTYKYTEGTFNLNGMMFFCPNDHNYIFAVVGFNYEQYSELLSDVLNSLSLLN